jgi:hypothetical protein
MYDLYLSINLTCSVADPGCLSRIRLSSIPNPNCLHPGSWIHIKEFKYFNQKNTKKWVLSSRKYDPGCSSRIRMLTFYPSRIPDPGVKKAPDPGSGSATLLTWPRFTNFDKKSIRNISDLLKYLSRSSFFI